jgi:hypothetical protein
MLASKGIEDVDLDKVSLRRAASQLDVEPG